MKLDDCQLYGFDNDYNMTVLAQLNMLLNGDGNAVIKYIYLKKREQLDIEITDTQSELQKLESRLQQDETAADHVINGTVKSIQRFAKESIVSREMLVTFFEAIYVTDPEHIELQWKFSDEFKEFLLEVERRADSAQEHTTQEKNA